MGQFVSLKITAQELAEHGMTSLAGTQWKNQAEMLKKKLDEDGTFVAERLGLVLGALEDNTAAGSIGIIVIPGVSGANVQTALESIKGLVDLRVTSADVNTALLLKEDKSITATHIKTVSFNANDGKFTFAHESGATTVIDTALEKVVTNFSYNAAAQSLDLTMPDSSVVSIPLSNFITENEFLDSSTIDFSVNSHQVTAVVKPGSITDTMLSSALVSILQSYVSTASNSASAASVSTSNAATSATASQSWAVGGTGTRAGEDTDNAKFYCEKTQNVRNDFVHRYNMGFLTQGNLMAGYYGKVNNLITGTDLFTAVGLTAGTLAVSGDITFLKFSHNYKTLFIPDRAIRTSISWDQIQAQNLVKGKVITIGDKQYLCRLMTGGNSNPASAAGGEWNDLIVGFTPNDADSHWSTVKTWMQEISSTAIVNRIYRGNASISEFGNAISTTATAEFVYRPVLELL